MLAGWVMADVLTRRIWLKEKEVPFHEDYRFETVRIRIRIK
jgi:hypothetical protein